MADVNVIYLRCLSRVYHRLRTRKRRRLTEAEFQSACLRGDQEVYEFIERLQHKQEMGFPMVPWLIRFDIPSEVVAHVRGKWMEDGAVSPRVARLESDEGVHEIAIEMTTSVRRFMNGLMKSDFGRYTRIVVGLERMLGSSGSPLDTNIRWTNVTLRKQRYPRPEIGKYRGLEYVGIGEDAEFYMTHSKDRRRISIWIARDPKQRKPDESSCSD